MASDMMYLLRYREKARALTADLERIEGLPGSCCPKCGGRVTYSHTLRYATGRTRYQWEDDKCLRCGHRTRTYWQYSGGGIAVTRRYNLPSGAPELPDTATFNQGDIADA